MILKLQVVFFSFDEINYSTGFELHMGFHIDWINMKTKTQGN